MDRICESTLDKIFSISSAGRYSIISKDEFLDSFPEGAEKSGGELSRALKGLKADGYIDVKYSDGEMYCVAPLKRYEPSPAPIEVNCELPEEREDKKPLIFSLLSGFAGGVAGGIIIGLIFAFI